LGIAGFQSNQIVITLVSDGYNTISWQKIVISFLTTLFTAYVLLGGVKRISSFADKIVPFMIILYVGTVIIILAMNAGQIQGIISLIMKGAFDFSSGFVGRRGSDLSLINLVIGYSV
jgi:AGCS family alanine or glycine:cation symporter